jgi:hypothetical protein
VAVIYIPTLNTSFFFRSDLYVTYHALCRKRGSSAEVKITIIQNEGKR